MESGSKSQHGMETPTMPASETAPTTSTRPTGVDPCSSLIQHLLSQAYAPLPPTSGNRVTDFQGSVVARPPWASAPQPPEPLPQDLLELDIDVPDREKTIRELVYWLVYNDKCRYREEQAATGEAPTWKCFIDRCRATGDLVEHATQCTAGNHCPVTNCALTKGIFRHYEACTAASSDQCSVCWKLNPYLDETTPDEDIPSGVQITFNVTADGLEADPDTSEQFWEHLTAEKSSTGNRPLHEYLASQTTTTPFKPNLLTARDWHGEMALLNPTSAGSVRSDTMRKLLEGIFPCGGQLDADDLRMVTLIAYTRKVEAEVYEESYSQENYFQLIDEKIDKIRTELEDRRKRRQVLDQRGTPLATNMQFGPLAVAVKDCHHQVAGFSAGNMDSLRNHLIHKLIQGFFPSKNQSAVPDRCMTDIILYARQVEAKMFEKASSRDEYYELLAEQLYKIQKEQEKQREKLCQVGIPSQPTLQNEQAAIIQLGAVLSAASGNGEGNISPLAKDLADALECRDADVQRKWMCRLFEENPAIVAEFVEWMGRPDSGVALGSGKLLLQEEKVRPDDQKPAAISGTPLVSTSTGDTETNAGANDVFIPVNSTGKTTSDWKKCASNQFRCLQDISWQCKVAVGLSVFLNVIFIACLLFFAITFI